METCLWSYHWIECVQCIIIFKNIVQKRICVRSIRGVDWCWRLLSVAGRWERWCISSCWDVRRRHRSNTCNWRGLTAPFSRSVHCWLAGRWLSPRLKTSLRDTECRLDTDDWARPSRRPAGPPSFVCSASSQSIAGRTTGARATPTATRRDGIASATGPGWWLRSAAYRSIAPNSDVNRATTYHAVRSWYNSTRSWS